MSSWAQCPANYPALLKQRREREKTRKIIKKEILKEAKESLKKLSRHTKRNLEDKLRSLIILFDNALKRAENTQSGSKYSFYFTDQAGVKRTLRKVPERKDDSKLRVGDLEPPFCIIGRQGEVLEFYKEEDPKKERGWRLLYHEPGETDPSKREDLGVVLFDKVNNQTEVPLNGDKWEVRCPKSVVSIRPLVVAKMKWEEKG